jgi:large subunit ribosomal protein L10e
MRPSNYRKPKNRNYTRKEFVKGFPASKIVKFTMGDTKAKFEYKVKLIAMEHGQIRHNALEAARIATNRRLETNLLNDYCLRIILYPHTILRENKMIFGAHADRISDGMRRSFGRPVGTAARVKPKKPIMSVEVNSDGLEIAKEALKLGRAKFPIPCRIIVEKS